MEPKKLTPEELRDAKELSRIADTFRFVAKTVANNTAVFPKGQKQAEVGRWNTIANLLEQSRNDFVGNCLIKAGVEASGKAQINWETGEITPITE